MLCRESDILSIAILTYNHEKYICKCLDSFINQEFSIPFSITIFDDFSTDSTINVIKRCYGDKISIHQQLNNVGIGRNFYDAATCSQQSKYIMVFSGDDWLLEKNSVQHMYDFLEENEDYVAVGGWVKIFNKDEGYINSLEIYDKDHTFAQMMCGKLIRGDPYMFRNIYHTAEAKWLFNMNPRCNEPQHWYYVLLNGKCGILHEYIRAYRFVSDTTSSNYNSTHTFMDSIFIGLTAYRKIEEKIGCDGYFRFAIIRSLFSAYRFAIAHLLKHCDLDSLKRLNAQVRLRDFCLMLMYVPSLIMGKGNYTKKTFNRIMKKYGEEYEHNKHSLASKLAK